ncbi:ribosylglycohydrolase [Mycobacterium colombiense]|uniref:Ribosylglycohydrolase n=1 Tax=Mycobacterium colombiense TaxID=339268 RepID=A0A1A2S5H5_9MYCO|nr:ADP-ribosylglycohydrolase family protein [Mycobacterium colombiense]OBH59468.1 ribosylglycohydrolase [Mycobacterium colombiense]
MTLTPAQLDRAVGALLGTAAGDALGAPYEFGPPRGPGLKVAMTGGGVWEPGEWTDDTSMAIAIAETAAAGADLREEAALDAIVQRWHYWMQGAKDVGIQTSQVLRSAGSYGLSARTAREASAALHNRTGRTAGNGSLMRTAPVALAYLDDDPGLVEAARTVSELTHFDPDAGDACVLWCLAIRHAILTGVIDARIGLCHLPADRRDTWAARLDAAELAPPASFPNNGWVVTALQAAWSAIATTPVPTEDPAAGIFRADHLRLALDAAVRCGNDTDTVAAIAGGLLGAVYGASAVPAEWRRLLHGWPGLSTRDLVALATRIVNGDEPFKYDLFWMTPVQHPHDDGVWLADVAALQVLPPGVDAVVSLCRVNDDDLPVGVEQIDIRLIDDIEPDANVNLDFVLTDTVRLIEQLRNEGRTVLLHCVACQSRTPAVAALYGARLRGVGVDQALFDVTASLPAAWPNPAFRDALHRLDAQ